MVWNRGDNRIRRKVEQTKMPHTLDFRNCSERHLSLAKTIAPHADLIRSVRLLQFLLGFLQSIPVGILLQNKSVTSLRLLESDRHEQGLGAQERLDLGLEGLVLHVDGPELLLVGLVNDVADVGQQDLETFLPVSSGTVRRNLLNVLVDLLGIGLEL
eukprot:CAMPEP_0197715540 /NCGR_PEP_ID=MMETSP1434-20131217/683_1 /TAXON_ID=265543 /ORGANISM="Minutocellus polymorphus, Strain CCMP3303" /LENGTH=156 /DNA_ID=CAMNT_0043299673 /DNA_START=80 /DNA_END=546 /DNA_ORIENTATION=+